jgi:phosphoesterase RecJ-like protein
MKENLIDLANQRIRDAQTILVISHIRPDGDAVGSLLSLGLSLQESGKSVDMVLADGVPSTFQHLPGTEQVLKKPKGIYELIIVLDCSDLLRLGEALEGYPPPDINIDHHVTNVRFASINLVDTNAVATTEILADILPQGGFPINKPIATNLLNGLITDTLGFRTSNTTPKALRVAADLMEDWDLDLSELYQQALLNRSIKAARYWGVGLSKIKRKDRLIWTTLTQADRSLVNYPGKDDADLINVLSSIKEADIALIFIEQPNGNIKVSWRAKPGFDVSQVALRFGGGGHKPAAGAEITGSMEYVQEEVIKATSLLLNGRPRQGKGE